MAEEATITTEAPVDMDAIRESALAEARAEVAEQYAGLEKNHEQVIADRKAASQKAKELAEMVDRYKAATRDQDIDDIENTFTSIEKADYESLLGAKKTDEAFEMRFKSERKEFAKQLEEKDKAIREANNATAEKEERLLALELDSVAVEKFLAAKGDETMLRDLKARIREDAKRNEDGQFFFPDQFGNPLKDSEGKELTIETYINEKLRVEAPRFFADVKGSGATGANGSHPPGTQKRSEFKPGEKSKFIREHGQAAYDALPD